MVMDRPSSSATTAVILLALAAPLASAAPAPLDRARALLDRADGRAAATVLEAALPGAPAGDRPALIAALRSAYEQAARQADAEGKAREARAYRENLAILGRKHPASQPGRGAEGGPKAEGNSPAPPAAPGAGAVGGETIPAPAAPEVGDDPAPLAPRERAGVPDPAPITPSETASTPEPQPLAARPAPAPDSKPAPALAPPPEMPEPERLPPPDAPPARRPTDAPPARRPSTPPPSIRSAEAPKPSAPAAPPAADAVAEADAAFLAGRYDEAGRGYAALARAHRLPEARRDHWAYCRMAAVVRRINAGPAGATEWAELHAEIGRIRALSPRNWFGEYLRNLVAQRSAPSRPGEMVLRGAAPDEAAPATAPRRRPGGSVKLARSATPPAPEIPQAPAAEAAPEPPPARNSGAAATQIRWKIRQTPNFCIFHADPALAERVAAVAEATREAQGKRWVGTAKRAAWAPKCDLYLYPTAADFARATGEPEESPGVTRMGQNQGRIVSRQVHLRADHPNVASAILPHEVTHVVLGDLFPTKPPPRWADEGMAVLAEPAAEQRNRARDLVEPLKAGRVFRVEQLVALDCPDGPYWPLYYAQSVSVTRFLLDQGSPAQFIKFLQAAERDGFEASLKRVYKIEGTNDLHKRWLAFAASQPDVEPANVAAEAAPARR